MIFISYNHTDRAVGQEIALFLAAEAANVWFDEWRVTAGDSITGNVGAALGECREFVILWSEHANRSTWVRKELNVVLSSALENGSPRIVPVRLDDTPLPPLLADLKYLRYGVGNESDRRELIRAVLRREPSDTFLKAVVKKYHELTRGSRGPVASDVKVCEACGATEFSRKETVRLDSDAHYSFDAKCVECGHTVWGYG